MFVGTKTRIKNAMLQLKCIEHPAHHFEPRLDGFFCFEFPVVCFELPAAPPLLLFLLGKSSSEAAGALLLFVSWELAVPFAF